MSRVTLRAQYKMWQPETTIEVADEIADNLVKTGRASKAEAVFSHEDDMPEDVRKKSHEALAVAEAAGGVNAVALRTAATAPFRKK